VKSTADLAPLVLRLEAQLGPILHCLGLVERDFVDSPQHKTSKAADPAPNLLFSINKIAALAHYAEVRN
jgi:hypothetical protein